MKNSTGSGGSWRSRRQSRDAEAKKGSLLKELPVLLLVAFVLALLVKTFLVQAFFIPSGSMETTLHGCTGCTGDRVLVTKPPYWFSEPQPGDIVVFQGPDTWTPEVQVAEPSNWLSSAALFLGRAIGVAPPSEDDYVKRVIATGGQTVQCCDDQGRVTVDGQPLDEPYIYENTPLETRPFGPVTLADGQLWVMGDHRSNSQDSRYHGPIGVDDVIGKASAIVWPFSRFTFLDSPDIQATASPAAAPGEELSSGLLLGVALLARRRVTIRPQQTVVLDVSLQTQAENAHTRNSDRGGRLGRTRNRRALVTSASPEGPRRDHRRALAPERTRPSTLGLVAAHGRVVASDRRSPVGTPAVMVPEALPCFDAPDHVES